LKAIRLRTVGLKGKRLRSVRLLSVRNGAVRLLSGIRGRGTWSALRRRQPSELLSHLAELLRGLRAELHDVSRLREEIRTLAEQ
jgi:hypothetical protein